MNIHDKKILAEWMEWTINHDILPEYYITKDGLIHWAVANYDPTVHPEQFKEVEEKLIELDLDSEVELILDEKYSEQKVYTGTLAHLWISDHMPEVTQAIIQVIKVPVK